jgi:hypothetical protein
VIECFLIDLVPELGHLFGSFPLVALVRPHSSIEVRVASNHFILPSGHISIVPFMKVSCYHSLWAVTLQVLFAPFYSGLL